MRLAKFGVVAMLVAAVWVPSVAGACSIDAPKRLDRLLASGELYGTEFVGVHEQRHIARMPGLFGLLSARSASVVDRYWGAPPDLSVTSHGAPDMPLLLGSACGDGASPVGHVSAHANSARGIEFARGDFSNLVVGSGDYESRLSAAEVASLDAFFGPSVAVSTGPDDYVLAYTMVLWRPILTLSVIGLIAYGVWSRVRGIKWGTERIFSRPTAVAGVLGVVAATAAAPNLDSLDRFGLVIALVFAMFVASLLRVPWTIFGLGLVLWGTVAMDLFGDLGGGDERLQTAIAVAIVGVSALAWSPRHWTRFPATLITVVGTFAGVMGVADVRGYRNTTRGVTLAAVVTAAIAAAIWWLVFRDRPIRPGGARLLPDEIAVAGQQPPSR